MPRPTRHQAGHEDKRSGCEGVGQEQVGIGVRLLPGAPTEHEALLDLLGDGDSDPAVLLGQSVLCAAGPPLWPTPQAA